jgi:hypothetical protein
MTYLDQDQGSSTCKLFSSNLVEWNCVPSSVVCVFPYVLSITADSIEIRSVVNGALLQTTFWPEMTMISSKVTKYLKTTLYVHKFIHIKVQLFYHEP